MMNTTPMPKEALVVLATANRSVNAHLADYYSLRWHDPFFIEVQSAWRKASADWEHAWKNLDFKFLKPVPGAQSAVSWPDPSAIPENHPARPVCEAYVAAKAKYHAALDHYASEP